MRINSPHLNLIYKACIKASKSLIRDFGEIEKLQVSTKGPGDFVTSADKKIEKILIEELSDAHPDYGILSEEVGEIKSKSTNKRWIIAFSKEIGFPTIKKQQAEMKADLLSKENKSNLSKEVKKLFVDAELLKVEEDK